VTLALVIAIFGSGASGGQSERGSANARLGASLPAAESAARPMSAPRSECPPNAKPVPGGCIPRGSARVVYGERCKSARLAVSHFRALTWERQRARQGELADRVPIVRGKTCRWARFAADTWQARARSARRALERWQRTVGHVVARLERGVRGTPMEGTGAILERHGRRYGVSPYFIVAVAATESSIGHAACSSNRMNVWGLSSCGSGWYVPHFRSWDEAILFFVQFIDRRFHGHSTPYSFRGYAACSDCWARKVSEWMGRLFGVPARTVYP
jgi:hypothetical protein